MGMAVVVNTAHCEQRTAKEDQGEVVLRKYKRITTL